MINHLQTRDDWDEKSLGAKGFTLIELLIVIIILGILAGVAIFAIGGITDKADANACTNERDTVENAVAAWALVNDEKPANATISLLTSTTNGNEAQLKKEPKYWDLSSGEPTIKSGMGVTWNGTKGECETV